MQTISCVPGPRAGPEPGVSVVMEQGGLLPLQHPYVTGQSTRKLGYNSPSDGILDLFRLSRTKEASWNPCHSAEIKKQSWTDSLSKFWLPACASISKGSSSCEVRDFLQGSLCETPFEKARVVHGSSCHPLFHFPSSSLHKTHTGLVGIRERKAIFLA